MFFLVKAFLLRRKVGPQTTDGFRTLRTGAQIQDSHQRDVVAKQWLKRSVVQPHKALTGTLSLGNGRSTQGPDDVSVDLGQSKAEGVRKGRDFADQSPRALPREHHVSQQNNTCMMAEGGPFCSYQGSVFPEGGGSEFHCIPSYGTFSPFPEGAGWDFQLPMRNYVTYFKNVSMWENFFKGISPLIV